MSKEEKVHRRRVKVFSWKINHTEIGSKRDGCLQQLGVIYDRSTHRNVQHTNTTTIVIIWIHWVLNGRIKWKSERPKEKLSQIVMSITFIRFCHQIGCICFPRFWLLFHIFRNGSEICIEILPKITFLHSLCVKSKTTQTYTDTRFSWKGPIS